MKKILLAIIFVMGLITPTFAWDVKTPEQLQTRINDIGFTLLNSSRIEKRFRFQVKKKSFSRDLYSDVSYINRTVWIEPELLPFIDNDEELAAILAHVISHGVDSYNGILRGYISVLNYWVSPNKYDQKADKLAVDYLINAGYNPLAIITIYNKIGKQHRYDVFSNHTLISRRLMYIYEYIYTKYPSILINNDYRDNIYYQNFLLTSRNNRTKLLKKVETKSTKKIKYSY